jgi:hypothetical protein
MGYRDALKTVSETKQVYRYRIKIHKYNSQMKQYL